MKLFKLFNPLLCVEFLTLNFSGGKSSSSSASTNTTNTTDKRLVVDNGAVGISADNSSIVMGDYGAINSAFNFANDTFGKVADILQANTAAVEHISATSTEAIQKSNAQAVAVTDTNRYLVAGGLAVVGIVAIRVWGK